MAAASPVMGVSRFTSPSGAPSSDCRCRPPPLAATRLGAPGMRRSCRRAVYGRVPGPAGARPVGVAASASDTEASVSREVRNTPTEAAWKHVR